jgi:hypothetical protein
VSGTYCSEVLSPAPSLPDQADDGERLSDIEAARPLPTVRFLLIIERVDGFFLERFTDRGELVDDAQYKTLDEAMRQVYSDYTISDWRLCPDGVDPLRYIRGQSNP